MKIIKISDNLKINIEMLYSLEKRDNKKDIDEWEKHAKHVSFASFFKNEISLEEDDFIDVVFDDFSDITGSHEGMASI